jgi:uncharacterized protein with von Willebrand factor type A (vWA) domain
VTAVLSTLVTFGHRLRAAGVDVHPGRMIDVAAALPLVDLASRRDVYHACRTLLVSRAGQIPAFDRVFDEYFGGTSTPKVASASEAPALVQRTIAETASLDAGGEVDDDAPRTVGMWSDAGGLAQKDFAAFTPAEIVAAQTALAHLVWSPGERRTRRWVPGHGPRIDLRRAAADSLRTGGDVVRLRRQQRRSRPRTLIVLCDVSGSMERYSRMLLHFVHALARRQQRFEAFLFSTRLARITGDLRARRVDEAMARVARSMPDWSGGTRIGDALAAFHQRWGRRVLHRGPVVLLISDGWDRGDPDVLRDQVARLQRSSHRLIWLNPLVGTFEYAPLTRGLRAALPYVDDFLPARTLNDLRDLASHLNALAAPRKMGSEVI